MADSYVFTKKEWDAIKGIRTYKKEEIILAVLAKTFDGTEPEDDDRRFDEAEQAIYELLLR